MLDIQPLNQYPLPRDSYTATETLYFG
jgi:hypothetical protein